MPNHLPDRKPSQGVIGQVARTLPMMRGDTMRRLLDAIYRWLHDPRYLKFWAIEVPEDEEWK